MKNIIFCLFLLVILNSCQTIKFDRYPGTTMPEFPENMRGKYNVIVKKSGTHPDTATIYVSKNSYTIYDDKNTAIDFLDSSHVLSSYDNNYFLFVKKENYWSGYFVEKKKYGLSVLNIAVPSKGSDSKRLKMVSRYFSGVKCEKTNNLFDIIECTAKMDENGLMKYIKKNRRNKVKLIQVKE